MRTTIKHLLPITALALASICGTAWAQQPATVSTGLGQAWPNAPDVSSSPRWHVYVFNRDGVRYIQVNDLNGKVRGAFAVAGGQYLSLPIGSDAQYVSTPQQRLTAPASSAPAETVYNDGAVNVTLTPQANGQVQMNAMDSECTGLDCSGGGRVN
ncbi:hypothetical protein [Dyella silvatica]|uniref:hypothetical protein n=1 Tax=Dyella silvatica TaxID=2992128 RepID=UPI002253B0E5|nr:hypothetical protein [Dyella silvatica]